MHVFEGSVYPFHKINKKAYSMRQKQYLIYRECDPLLLQYI